MQAAAAAQGGPQPELSQIPKWPEQLGVSRD